MNDLVGVLLLSTGAGLATGLGGLMAISRRPGQKQLGFMMGFTAGVMLALAFVGLLWEAWEEAGYGTATIAFAVGALTMFAIDVSLPHIRFAVQEPGVLDRRLFTTGLLIAVGIALVILIAIWLPHIFFNAASANEVKEYASWIVLTVNVLCFGWGLLSMSMFKVNIDTEVHQKGPLEKMVLAAFLLEDLGYKYAKNFIDKQFKITEEKQSNNGSTKKGASGGSEKQVQKKSAAIEASGNKSTEPNKT